MLTSKQILSSNLGGYMNKDLAYSFYNTALSYSEDAKILLKFRGIDSFNCSSFIDDGEITHKVNVTCETMKYHPATGPTGSLHFALGHAIELLLKVILMQNDCPLENLKRVGHNLKKATQLISELGIYVPDKEIIISFSKIHNGLVYRYPQKSRLEFHDPHLLLETIEKLSKLVNFQEFLIVSHAEIQK